MLRNERPLPLKYQNAITADRRCKVIGGKGAPAKRYFGLSAWAALAPYNVETDRDSMYNWGLVITPPQIKEKGRSAVIKTNNMEKLKNNWLRAILFTMLGLGISFGANASTDHKDPKNDKKEAKVVVLKKDKAVNIKQTTLYWYRVNPANNQTLSSTPAYHDTKSNVMSDPDECQDIAGNPICLFGSTNPALPAGTNVGTPAPQNRILKTEE